MRKSPRIWCRIFHWKSWLSSDWVTGAVKAIKDGYFIVECLECGDKWTEKV